jgi:U4/U6 small nuclear ribonucleoprotein PRP4
VWTVPNCELKLTLKGHNCNVGAIVFHPHAMQMEENSVCALASCAADGSVKLWTMERYEKMLNDIVSNQCIIINLNIITNYAWQVFP